MGKREAKRKSRMRIIDDRGWLFGIINVIDFLVVFFLTAIICIVPLCCQMQIIGKLNVRGHTLETELKRLYEEAQKRIKTDERAKLIEAYRKEKAMRKREYDELKAWKKRLLKEHKKLKDFK